MQNQNFIFRSFVCIAVLAMLSVLAVKSWGACYTSQLTTSIRSAYYCAASSGDYVFSYPVTASSVVSGSCKCDTPNNYAPYSYTIKTGSTQGGRIVSSFDCSSFCETELMSNASYRVGVSCTIVECNNKCEVDSVNTGGFIQECLYDITRHQYYRWICPGTITNCNSCGQEFYSDSSQCHLAKCRDNPSDPSCIPEVKDSVMVCENATQVEDGPIYTQMLLFKCEVSDNSQGYDDDKCRLMMNVPGTCGQNGYESGVQPSDSVAPEVDCFASFDNTCYMMDKKSQNTFACSCDNNSCYLAKLAVASGDCKNPYASSSPSSSASSSPSSASSASSSGSSSPSSSEGRPDENISSPATESGSSGDWEYDYSGILNAINNNVIYVGNGVQAVNSSVQNLGGSIERLNGTGEAIRANTQGIISNTQYTNTLINQKIVPAINSASSAITGKLDQVHGEWSGLWNDFTTSTSTEFQYDDTLDYTLEPDYSDEVTDTSLTHLRDTIMAHKRSLDSVIAYVDSVRNDTSTNYVALDSIYDWGDTSQIKSKLSKFFIPNVSTLQSCPAFDFTVDWPIIGTQRTYINFGNVLNGVDFCELIRGFVRFLTLIFILFNSVRAIIRAFSSGGT